MKKAYRILLVLFLFVLFFIPMEKVQAKHLTGKQIYEQLSKKLMQRKKKFAIRCDYTKTVDSIVQRINSEYEEDYFSVFFDMAAAVDDKETTDDSDYLFGLIDQAYCYYSKGALRFYGVTYFETKKQTQKVNKKTEILAEQIMNQQADVYGRIQLAYAFVINHVRYDYRKNCISSAYGGYYKQKTVCNGYALMLYKLLMRMGIPCKFVSGKLKERGNWYLHAWNMVEYQGKWYELDACSDDADDGQVYLDFFMKSSKSMKKTHRKDFGYNTKKFKQKYKMSTKDAAVPKTAYR